MTKRLYYTDSYIREFTAEILERKLVDNKPAVVLDQTAFYPESGGQPYDTGILGEARVVRVLEDDAGRILHFLEGDIPEGRVSGRIDWERRFDHMQQHTGQHILSQAFLAAARAQTLSFHLGQTTSTIDVDMAQPSPSLMNDAQTMASDIVFQNRNVRILTADREGLAALGIRKESQREGEIRIIDVEGFDRSACGGTHVRNTGEIGLVCVLGYERYKGGTRVEFAAGGRALKAYTKDHELLKALSRLYSAPPDAIPDLADKMMQERIALAREIEVLRGQALEQEAKDLFTAHVRTAYAATVKGVYRGRSLDTVKTLAQKLASRPGTLAILALEDACQIVVARSGDLDGSCNDAVKSAASRLGGKGGGRPELAQAGGFPADSLNHWMAALEDYFLSRK